MKNAINVIICIFVLGIAGPKLANSAPQPVYWCVDQTGESDYPSLQAALTAAQTYSSSTGGVCIKVAQGTYTGNFIYNSSNGYAIFLQGGYEPDTYCASASRVLDPTNTTLRPPVTGGHVLQIGNGGNITVEGFTIQEGTSTSGGAGLDASSFSASGDAHNITLKNNMFSNNSATDSSAGGGVRAKSYGQTGAGSITITDNIVTMNTVDQDGGGMYLETRTTAGTMFPILVNGNTFTNYSAGSEGGGIHILSYSVSGI